MAKAIDLIVPALSLIGVIGAGETPSAEDSELARVVMNDMLDGWANEELLIPDIGQVTHTVPAGLSSFTVGPTGDKVAGRPISVLDAYFSEAGINYPITIVDRSQWNLVQDTAVYDFGVSYLFYEGSMPNGTVRLSPKTGSSTAITMDVKSVFANFPDVNATDVQLSPGYKRAIQYNVAVELAPFFEKQVSSVVARIAVGSKSSIKRANINIGFLDSPILELMSKRSRGSY